MQNVFKLPITAVCGILLATTALSDIRSIHCPLGCPANPEGNTLIFQHLYALSNDNNTKFADWVAYEVDVVNFGPSPGRDWDSDPLLGDDQTLEEDDYRGAHNSNLESDRGHQAPLASFAGSRYWSELNYLSNITPQDSDLNQGPWKDLEEAVRSAVSYRNSLFVITGPIYTEGDARLPNADEDHVVPDAYFKVVYTREGSAAGFVMNQETDRSAEYCDFTIGLEKIRELAGFSFPPLASSNALMRRLGCK